ERRLDHRDAFRLFHYAKVDRNLWHPGKGVPQSTVPCGAAPLLSQGKEEPGMLRQMPFDLPHDGIDGPNKHAAVPVIPARSHILLCYGVRRFFPKPEDLITLDRRPVRLARQPPACFEIA